mgnify:CR=1 FL=1
MLTCGRSGSAVPSPRPAVLQCSDPPPAGPGRPHTPLRARTHQGAVRGCVRVDVPGQEHAHAVGLCKGERRGARNRSGAGSVAGGVGWGMGWRCEGPGPSRNERAGSGHLLGD